MATQVSPGVVVTEIDKSLNLAQVALTDGGFAGMFRWGPANVLQTVISEEDLVQRFWKPNTTTAEYFFTAANFLSYSRSLRVVRVVSNTAYNAAATPNANNTIKNGDEYESNLESGGEDYYSATFGNWAAKYPGALGNGLRVEICASANAYSETLSQAALVLNGNTTVHLKSSTANAATLLQVGDVVTLKGIRRTVSAVSNTNQFTINASMTVQVSNTTQVSGTLNAVSSGSSVVNTSTSLVSFIANNDVIIVSNATTSVVRTVSTINSTAITFATDVGVVSGAASIATGLSTPREWRFARIFDGAPGTSEYVQDRAGANDEMHIVVVDTVGNLSGVANSVLEKYSFVSKASDARTENGVSNYYRDAVNRKSPFIWFTGHDDATWGNTAANNIFTAPAQIVVDTLSDGADGSAVSDADLLVGYDLFKQESAEISFLLGGPVNASVATSLISNVIEPKRYVMGFFSPDKDAVVNNAGNEATDIITFRNSLPSTSYAVLDSGWKYQYDKYNDVYRWIPLNGDVAGCLVRTDGQAESWFSPAGFSRGQIKNVVKLAFNPNLTERDDLYRNGVNPVVSFPGQGTVLFGDKTLLSRPSAFDRINVRRLFVVLEKTIENSAKQQLFEQNDEFTRNAFVNLVEPFLRSVRGRRGITDFYIVCDETNNPPDAVDRNEFRADIYVKPVRSINFIQLNFTAVRSDVAFTEVVTNLG